MQVAGRKVLVIGAARSGIASSRFLAQRGAIVALNDRKPVAKWPPEALDLKTEGVGFIEGDPPSWLLDQIDLVVVSPGVPTKAIPIRYADRRGAEVIGEVELASRFLRGRVVAITGTNGKTTTTTLIGEMLKDAGLKVQVGGNIGKALISLIDSSSDDGWTVAEVSSFQLETIVDFHPTVAAVLNVTPNHMDRYESLMDYAAAKHRVFANQTPSDLAILNADDEIVSSWASGLRAPVMQFSVKRELEEGLFLRGRDLICRLRGQAPFLTAQSGGERVLATRDEMQLRGTHNVENVLAAMAAGLACGAPPESLRETVRRFRPVEHRLEEVAEINGVRFFNDSKATSVDATMKALEAFSADRGKVVLILGGRGKQAPYSPLARLISERVRRMILIGEDAPAIERELKSAAPFEHASDMHDAVERAFAAAEAGDVVLLAPACASFDMFESFEHRGRVFKEEVSSLEFGEEQTRNSKPETRNWFIAMPQKLQIDKWLFSATVGLALFGVVMVYSASAVIALQENHGQFHYVIKQGIWTLLGFVVMFMAMRFDYQRLNRRWIVYGALLVTILLLLSVFAFPPVNGARRWIKFGSFSAQPSEVAKLSLAIFLAYLLEKRAGEERSFWKTFLPCMIPLAVLAGLVVKEPDLGTALMLAIICITICFAAGVRPRHVVYAAIPGVLYVGKMVIFTPFRWRRMATFIDPWADQQDGGYQVVQSLIAVGSGGSHGLGFAQGRQKLLFLPFAHSDFIFAVIGEELGLIGALIVVFVFAVFLWRGMRAALRAPDRFGMLLGIGIVVGIVAQALLNMSVVLALVPTKGIPLPFISYGGSSLVPTLAGVGILLNISQYAPLVRRAGFAEDDYEEEWEDQKRSKTRRAPRRRASAVARPRYG